MDVNERICLECKRPLHGRPDKKFCMDGCRNAYNNKQNSAQINHVRRINHILAKNRRLLDDLIKPGDEISKCLRIKLSELGFDFRYHTHQYLNKKGQTYNFCYDLGYLALEGDWLLIVKRKENTQ